MKSKKCAKCPGWKTCPARDKNNNCNAEMIKALNSIWKIKI